MALRKESSYNGKRGSYWRIIAMHSDSLYNQTIVRLALYPSREAREKDESGYVAIQSVSIKGLDYDREKAYLTISHRDEFEGSINC